MLRVGAVLNIMHCWHFSILHSVFCIKNHTVQPFRSVVIAVNHLLKYILYTSCESCMTSWKIFINVHKFPACSFLKRLSKKGLAWSFDWPTVILLLAIILLNSLGNAKNLIHHHNVTDPHKKSWKFWSEITSISRNIGHPTVSFLIDKSFAESWEHEYGSWYFSKS